LESRGEPEPDRPAIVLFDQIYFHR
jgi:hypothetical protein